MITFEELGISPSILKAVRELGFENPMPVQEKVIPLMLGQSRDIIALAQTGTGKTAAFGLPLVQEAIPGSKLPTALILCPTRELCLQIAGDLNDYALYSNDIKVLPVYGGSSIDTQVKALRSGVQIIVATPGRMNDLIERGVAKLSAIKRVVLDEADEMLNMGFLDSINTILAEVPENRNTLLFSATMPPQIASISKKYMKDPLEVTIGTRNSGAENVKHIYYTVHAKDKYLVLKRIADNNPGIFGLVFCRTRRETQEIADKLIQDGYNAEALHGDLSQGQRDLVMSKFRSKNIKMLVATDVAARGLDVDDLTHVINYTLPDDHEVYTHRSGRTGRAGKTGISIALVNLRERHLIKQIEKKLKKEFKSAVVPTGREICEKQLFHLIDRMEKVELDQTDIDSYLPVIYRKLEWLDKEEVIKRFVSLSFNRFLEYYRNANEIKSPISDGPGGEADGKRGRRREAEGGYTRMFISLGKMDGFYPPQLIDLVNRCSPGKKVALGDIDLKRNFSFFEIETRFVDEIIPAMNRMEFEGRPIKVEPAEGKGDIDDAPRPRSSANRGDDSRPRSGGYDRTKKDAPRGGYDRAKKDAPRGGGFDRTKKDAPRGGGFDKTKKEAPRYGGYKKDTSESWNRDKKRKK
ncbi:MAG: DEAD/DEAH box helicase [Bacteroidota bacterium]